MRNAIGLLVLALTLWLGACASDPHALPENAPAWVLNQDAKRPGILSGVGSAISSGDAAADNLAAEENAVNDILRQISVSVNSIYDRRVHDSNLDGVSTIRIDTFSNVTTTTAGEIPSLRRLTKWLDEKNRRYYVKAEVSEQELANALGQKLSRELVAFREGLQRGEEALMGRKWLDAIAAAKGFYDKMPYALMLDSQVIGLGFKGNDEFKNLLARAEKLDADIKRLAKIRVTIPPRGFDEAFKGKVEALVSGLGYQVVDNGVIGLAVNGSIAFSNETSAGEAIRRAVLNGRVTLGDESGQTHSALIQDKDAQAPSEVAFRSAGRSDSDMSGALADKALPQIASILESRLRIR